MPEEEKIRFYIIEEQEYFQAEVWIVGFIPKLRLIFSFRVKGFVYVVIVLHQALFF